MQSLVFALHLAITASEHLTGLLHFSAQGFPVRRQASRHKEHSLRTRVRSQDAVGALVGALVVGLLVGVLVVGCFVGLFVGARLRWSEYRLRWSEYRLERHERLVGGRAR